MRVNIVAWVGQELPFGLKPGVQDITPTQFFQLFEEAGCDVALMHARGEKKKDPDGTPILAIDERYRKFRQR